MVEGEGPLGECKQHTLAVIAQTLDGHLRITAFRLCPAASAEHSARVRHACTERGNAVEGQAAQQGVGRTRELSRADVPATLRSRTKLPGGPAALLRVLQRAGRQRAPCTLSRPPPTPG